MSHKGQVISIDAIAAVTVFAVILVFLMAFWSNTMRGAANAVGIGRLGDEALSASGALVEGGGIPFNWDENISSRRMVGLASSRGVLDRMKLGNFTALGYAGAKSALGVSNDFYFSVESANGSVLYSLGNSTYAGRQAVSIVRFAMLNGSPVRVRFVSYG